MISRSLLALAILAGSCSAGTGPVTTAATSTQPGSTRPPAVPSATGASERTEAGRPAGSAPIDPSCADVVGGRVITGSGTFTIEATVSSVDTRNVYADRWEVRTTDGGVLGTRELLHDHAAEQPFTRSLSGVAIPQDVTAVELHAHHMAGGFCGEPLTLEVQR